MAEVRKSGKQVAARKLAREKAAEFREKQDTLEQLAADYFVVADSIEEIEVNIAKEITAARERGQKQTEEARARAVTIIGSMLDLGTPRDEVAGRLGISTRDVRRNTPSPKTAAASSKVTPAPSLDGPEEMDDTRNHVTAPA